MRKIVFFVLFGVGVLCADALETKVRSLIGEQNYQKHQNLIEVLFENKQKYYIAGNINYHALLDTLKTHGLLHLKYEQPQKLHIDFEINNNTLKSIKVLKDTFNSMGYYHIFTKKITKTKTSIVWEVILDTQYVLDPFAFVMELRNYEARVKDIAKHSKTRWSYKLDFDNLHYASSLFITTNEQVSLTKPLQPYFISVDKRASLLQVRSHRLNKWYPYIVFYDNDFAVLEVIDKKRVYRGITVKIPQKTQYIKIGDYFNLINIKRGLKVTIKQ